MTITLSTSEYEMFLAMTDVIKKEQIDRKAPVNAKDMAWQHLHVLEQVERMGGHVEAAEDFLRGYNRYAKIKLTRTDLDRMREAYHRDGMYALLPSEHQQ